MKSDHRSRSISASYTETGVADDSCSTVIDTRAGMTSESTTAVRLTTQTRQTWGSLVDVKQGEECSLPVDLTRVHKRLRQLRRGDGEEVPLAGDALELVTAALLELES
jgi:hypothetical protein